MMDQLRALGWGDYLDEGEGIIWQGRPDQSVALGLDFPVVWSISGALFVCFLAVFLTQGLINATTISTLIFLALVVSACLLTDTYRRRRTWYTLTDRRAFIATDYPVIGKSIRSYRITPQVIVEFQPRTPASIFFAEEGRDYGRGRELVKVGFRRLFDGQKVYRLIQDIQMKGGAQ
ncbi:hypothetical protein SAMN04488030_2242 [Aliiroseovarius halocynthiae]|uniref:Aspartate carbamoyltransferase catalytic subunit n=1 Tax=Aliiroseovarius halocynthiae TaxID=985055 RepID=A0A545SZV5_9RHOB|nr:hypothetical protein [Aliiroseovarius halocynthiae]TQV70459.1 hypothetical protein FIL88_00725 [Aliiroseovarius halocynthiae]SMR81820.1 hypothetical protein SAMN04488030_2242 [Aliiroseovarius halocynthiae]